MADRSISEIRTRINDIREIIESGVTSVTVDGTTTQFDLAVLRAELRSLESQLPENKRRRPRSARICLDG